MRDGPAPRWMLHVLPALAILGLVLTVLALCGCVTVKDCGVGLESRQLVAGCEWDFGRASR